MLFFMKSLKHCLRYRLLFKMAPHKVIMQIICFRIMHLHMHACTFHDAVMQLLCICINGWTDAYKAVLKLRFVDKIDYIRCIFVTNAWCMHGVCISFKHAICMWKMIILSMGSKVMPSSHFPFVKWMDQHIIKCNSITYSMNCSLSFATCPPRP